MISAWGVARAAFLWVVPGMGRSSLKMEKGSLMRPKMALDRVGRKAEEMLGVQHLTADSRSSLRISLRKWRAGTAVDAAAVHRRRLMVSEAQLAKSCLPREFRS